MPGWWPPVRQGDTWSLQPVSSEGSSRRGGNTSICLSVSASGGACPARGGAGPFGGVWVWEVPLRVPLLVASLLAPHKQAGSLSGESVMAAASPLAQCPAWEGGHRSKEVAFRGRLATRGPQAWAGGERPQHPVADPRGAGGAPLRLRAAGKAVGGLSQHFCLGLPYAPHPPWGRAVTCGPSRRCGPCD